MTIYPSIKVMPYVYRLDNPVTGEFYIGYREANIIPSNDDLPKYRTSQPYTNTNFDFFIWSIIAEFFDGDSAYDFEQLLIYENWNNPLLLNKSCFYGKKRCKIPKGTQHSEEHKQNLSHSKMGKKHSKEHSENIAKALTGKPHTQIRKENISKGTKGIPKPRHVVDANGQHYSVSVDDPRYISGELVIFSKGRVTIKDANGNKFSVFTNDPRYISGELVYHTKGTANAYAYSIEGESMGRINLTDPRWKTGEIKTSKKS